MKIKKFIALMLGTALSIGALSGCVANNTTTIDQAELGNQIKAYIAAKYAATLPDAFTPSSLNEKLFYRLADYVTVYPDGRVVFTFRNGVEVGTEI